MMTTIVLDRTRLTTAGRRRATIGMMSCLLLAGGLCAALAEAATSQTLNADQIKMLITGTTVEGQTVKDDRPFRMTIHSGGRLSGEVDMSTTVAYDEGKWWIEGDQVLCMQWQRWAEGRKGCYTVAREGNRIARWRPSDGSKVLWPDWTIVREGPQVRMVASRPSPPPQPLARPAEVAPDRDPPTIDVPSEMSAESGLVAFEGRVKDDSRIIEVAVNGQSVNLDTNGSFAVRRGVPQGRNILVVTAMDEWGNRSSRQVVVTRPVAPARPAVASTSPGPAQAALPAGIQFGRYHALVIGNNKYRRLTPLKTAVVDAKAVAELLEKDYGFAVELLIDATRTDLIGALSHLRAKLTTVDNLLIYYAGHGNLDEVAEQGYWLPVDAAADEPSNWVSTNDITVMVRVIHAKHIMVVADSCYSGTLVRDAQINTKTATTRGAWLKRMAEKRARTALVSGGLEPVLDGGGGGHSVFAKAFIDALRENKGVLDGEGLFDRIKRPIVVNSDQTPQYSDIRNAGHDGGDFLFVRR